MLDGGNKPPSVDYVFALNMNLFGLQIESDQLPIGIEDAINMIWDKAIFPNLKFDGGTFIDDSLDSLLEFL